MYDYKQYQKEYTALNKDKRNTQRRERYAKAHPERVIGPYGLYQGPTPEQVQHHLEVTRQWKKDNKAVLAGYTADRQRMLREVKVGHFTRKGAWEASNGICGHCGNPIDKSIPYPDPLSLSYDHIIPITKGGMHCQSNIQCVHRICNIKKGNKTP